VSRRYEIFVFGEGEDTVVRLHQFRAAHPDWPIGYDASSDLWRAHRELEDNGSEEHVRYLLRDLLDKLQALPDL
jgi:hypothetical protein